MTAALFEAGAHIPNQEKRLGDAPADSVRRGVPLPPPAPLPAPGGAARRSAAGDSVVYFSGGGGLARLGAPPPVWCYPLT